MANTFVSTIILVAVGAFTGFFYVKVLKKQVLGNVWGAIIIGIVGGVLGGFLLSKVFPQLIFLMDNKLNVDFIATITGALLLVWIFHKITKHQED